jgi:hypothetical protein
MGGQPGQRLGVASAFILYAAKVRPNNFIPASMSRENQSAKAWTVKVRQTMRVDKYPLD